MNTAKPSPHTSKLLANMDWDAGRRAFTTNLGSAPNLSDELPDHVRISRWCTPHREVYVLDEDDHREIVTYCEGDLIVQLFATFSDFATAFAHAERFYHEH